MSNLSKVIGKMFHRTRKRGKLETSEDAAVSTTGSRAKVYLKALPLRRLSDVDIVKREVKAGNILILKVSPLARKSIDDVKRAVNELCDFTESVGGDIARLGEERVVVTPSTVKIWREKPVTSKEETSTGA